MNIKTRLLVDLNNLNIRTLFAGHGVNWEKEGYGFHRHLVLNTLFANIRKFNPCEIILCIDAVKTSWRKKVYSEYKANRKLLRDASDFDWSSYFEHINIFVEDLKFLPFKVIQVPYSEADDIIAVLSKNLSDSENIVLSSDSDFIQLLKNPHVKIFDPLKNKYVTDKDPDRTLHIKIIQGDSGDNIPAIKERVGEKTAIKLLDTGALGPLLESSSEIRDKYERNKTLISFDYIPNAIGKLVLDTYHSYPVNKEPRDYYRWFIEHKLRKLVDDFSKIHPLLKKLERREDEMSKLF